MIVATAGHIDHGKTALVKALTGIDADRLPEEKARGITVDLGFAYTRLGTSTVGFVDVPGHERLVRTMVAGATGVDFALIVVAADDGVMPQTREHIAILDLLGLRRSLVAITKSDRVDARRLSEVEAQVRAALADTGLAATPVPTPVLACSALSGAGLAEVTRELGAAAAMPSDAVAAGDFRLAVDRCFTIVGAGLVVTGAIHSGAVRPGDHLVVCPSGFEARVRGVRAGDEPCDVARAGQRCALNLTGPRLSRSGIHRGDWILAPHLHGPTSRLDVSLRVLPGEARPLRHRTPVHIHLGAASLTGRVLLPPETTVEPGAAAHAQIALDGSLGALHGDRFVLRDASAARTLGGGRVIDVDGPRRGAWAPVRRAAVAALDTTDHGAALAALLDLSEVGADLDRFARTRNIPRAEMSALSGTLDLVTEAGGRRGFAGARIVALGASVAAILDATHRSEPDNPGLTVEEIGERLAPAERPALRVALDRSLGGQHIARTGPHFHRPDHVVRLAPREAALYDVVRTVLEEAGLDQPRLADLAARVDRAPEALRPSLDKFGRLGWLRRVSGHYYVLPAVLAELADRARTVAAAHPQALLTVGRFREATGISRNMTLPLLTYFDARGFTTRVTDGRLVRPGGCDL
ncbi:selenocysteine-specific translation elongation factor [Methylobacterium sp. A49B]|uniref:Selenocysteine-specific elongation factor n=1 Tax=Methylobacterium mesophilicum SR1.6/6 TaxID=908290 RepID=A0A6B9FJF6_9HYPH|nr:selenocysteine-specific translation elongation factor [Methylobacterium mesophilicum]QGY02507.1 selenocysteine-specific translation elongation factor [Methylobacterium mesophilicum SR1.6/6]